MEPKTKKILAVVLIAVIAVGVGIGVYMILPQPYGAVVTGQLRTPGVPAGVPDDHILRVGILDPMTEIQGEYCWEGAYLACDEINSAGGVTVGNETYYFGLVAEDTREAATTDFNPAEGVQAAEKIRDIDLARYIIGGFRTESLVLYREPIMDAKMLFLGTGAATDSFCKNVSDDYNHYKYWFRVMPLNSTKLATELLTYLAYLKGYMQAAYAKNITRVAILREDLSWTVPMKLFLQGYLPLYGFNQVLDVPFPITATQTDFLAYWSLIEGNNTQITIPVISAQGGILATKAYKQFQPQCLLVGIDVMSQMDTFWADSEGACEYEVITQTLTRTNKTTLSIPFWDSFIAHFGHEPLYTGVGAYDAMYLLKYAIQTAQNLTSTALIPALEAIDEVNTIEGVAGNLAFTDWHDLKEGTNKTVVPNKIWGVALMAQWQAGGIKHCVSSGGQIYPEYVVTAPLALPPWGINS
jgi:branched-chain amino acid transport system substrate-binding protein